MIEKYMFDLFDFFFSDYKWYRQLCGGTWYLYECKDYDEYYYIWSQEIMDFYISINKEEY